MSACTADAARSRAPQAPLDFYTNKSAKLACEKPRSGLRLRSSDGLWAKVRCGCNDCRGCYGMKSFERAQMVYEDALVEQPRYGITLSTRAPVWDGERYREGKHELMRSLRREFGRVEALEFIEQTSGKAPRSGGHRRGHGHNLVKMEQPGQVLALEKLCREVWRRKLGAWQVNVAELQSAGGAVHYLTVNLALEKGKALQAPVTLPKGTRTLRSTRGYWSLPVEQLRERAREHNAYRRLEHALVVKLDDGTGYVDGTLLELWAEFEWDKHQARTWELWEVYERPGSLSFEPLGPVERVEVSPAASERSEPADAAGRAIAYAEK